MGIVALKSVVPDTNPTPRAAARQAEKVARYYAWLDKLTWFDERRADEGHGAIPVHRALTDPAGGPPSPFMVHGLMLQGLDLGPMPRALDAGCGYGATMLDLAPRLGGRWTGLTLSSVQAERGMAEVMARRLVGSVHIEVGSYDEKPPGRYDLIYEIESLIHSADPAHTIANLAGALDVGGYLVIVDDMPVETMPAEPAARLARFKRFWRCPVAPSRASWVAHLQGAGLTLVAEQDLNPLLRVRGMAAVAPRLAELRRKSVLSRLVGRGVRCEAEMGGLLLETLQTDGFVHYRVLVAQRR